jgi:hypothetical protein
MNVRTPVSKPPLMTPVPLGHSAFDDWTFPPSPLGVMATFGPVASTVPLTLPGGP